MKSFKICIDKSFLTLFITVCNLHLRVRAFFTILFHLYLFLIIIYLFIFVANYRSLWAVLTFKDLGAQKIYIPTLCCISLRSLPMFKRMEMSEGGGPLPLVFQYLILMIWRLCDLNLVMISSLHWLQNAKTLKLGCLFFRHFM